MCGEILDPAGLRVLRPRHAHLPHLGRSLAPVCPVCIHTMVHRKKETVSPALCGWGWERTVIGDNPGLQPRALPCCSELGVGTHSSSTWNPFMAGQPGSSALNHAPDDRPFRELLIQITSFPHRLQARHRAGDLSCPCSLSLCLAVTHRQPVQSGPGG